MNRPRLIETLCHDGIIPPPRRPVILEQGLEQVASREEEAHPIFQRYTRRLSWWMLVLNLMQWACFLRKPSSSATQRVRIQNNVQQRVAW